MTTCDHAVYESLQYGDRFYSSYDITKSDRVNCLSAEGELWYRILFKGTAVECATWLKRRQFKVVR